MATEYGYRTKNGNEEWSNDRGWAEDMCRDWGYVLIAREVSEPRIVSIRA